MKTISQNIFLIFFSFFLIAGNKEKVSSLPASERTFTWSGFTWIVKNSDTNTIGPGPNYFSNSTDNVWIDNAGELHLKIIKRNSKYYCAEVKTIESVGYGTYTYYVSSKVDNLDKNVVVGLFTWNNNDCKTNANSEIDIEFSRWGNINDSTVIQYSVQPSYGEKAKDRFHRFPMQLNGDYTIHFISWTPNIISWSSYHGHTNPPPQNDLIASWTFDSTHSPAIQTECGSTGVIIPAPENDTKIDLNLWLNKGNEPSDGQEAEVIIQRVDYKIDVPQKN
jgi:hypothetical protein